MESEQGVLLTASMAAVNVITLEAAHKSGPGGGKTMVSQGAALNSKVS